VRRFRAVLLDIDGTLVDSTTRTRSRGTTRTRSRGTTRTRSRGTTRSPSAISTSRRRVFAG
jgi:beta-phosphoglucomutase-like phosphatase (HAD superfamily)